MEKLQSKVLTVKEAALAKYNDDCFEVNNLNYISFSPKRKASLSQAMDLSKRSILALDGCDITNIGSPTDIVQLCPNLEELDLTNNHISDWEEVLPLISQLDQLRVLNLTNNPLATTENDITKIACLEKCSSIKKLILNNTGVTLKFVYSLLEYMTGVDELFLSLNEYSDIPETEKTFPNITNLHLNEHCIKEWSQILSVGKIFPHLKQLTMTNCPLEMVSPHKLDEYFSKLEILRLNKTAICDWDSIDALNAFPCLNEVKLIGIPLLEDDLEETRHLMLARLPKITKINGGKIVDKEREDAERFFIRHHMDDEYPPKRYHDLVKVHGILERLAEVNLAPPTSVKLSIIYEDKRPFVREIPVKQTTRNFKKYLSNELGVPSSKIKVFYNDLNSLYGPDEMRYLDRTLCRYNMADGDEIIIHNKNYQV